MQCGAFRGREDYKLTRKWFDALDEDHSGIVGADELEDPLISMGP